MRAGMAWLIAASLASCAGGESQRPPYGKVEVLQVVHGLNNPESVAFSADGKWLYVSNCGSAQFGADKHVGFVAGDAAISKLSVAADGTLAVANLKLVQGLSGTLGVTVAPYAVGPYPAGALFVCVGGALVTNEAGVYVSDAKSLGTRIAVFDPESGATLGKIDLGVGSAVAVALGHPLLLPNGIAFDGEGGLIVSDTGVGGDHLEPKIKAQPGVLRLAIGSKGDVTGHTFTPVSGGPNGVAWNAKEKALYWVTCGGQGPEGGALFRNGKAVALDLGPSDGIAFTPAGTVIVSRFKGDLVAFHQGRFPNPAGVADAFNFPSDIKLRTLADGSSIVVVPEQEAWNATPWGQSLRVVRLPAGY
jgi:DNA-binding beta-propeller fold protein YncE